MKTIDQQIRVEQLLDDLGKPDRKVIRKQKRNHPYKRVVAIMGKQVLVVEEGRLLEVVKVVRAGMVQMKDLSPATRRELKQWCNDEEKRLAALGYK